jgi:hypothetical protein
MLRNPFRYLQYVSPDGFIGRWPLVESIAQDLHAKNGNSHAIIAGQRCGKTSLLEALAHQLRQPIALEPGDSLALPLYIDFKAGSFDCVEAVLAFILDRVYRQISTVVRQHPLGLWPTLLRLGARWFEKLLNAPTLSAQDFEDGLGYIIDQVDLPTLPVRLVLMLDEIDKSFDQPWTDALFNQARSLICSSDLRTRLRLVLTSSQRFLDQRTPHNSSLCDVLVLHYLGALDAAGLAELSARVDGLPSETAAAINRQSGGHPFLAQYLLYHLWEQVGETGICTTTAAQVDRLASGFLHKRLFELEGWANAVEAEGMAAYKVLSATSNWVSEAQLLAAVNAPVSGVKQSLIGLCSHGLAMHDEDWTHYKYTGDLFRTWFNTYGVVSFCPEPNKPQSSPSTMTQPVHIKIDTGGGPYIAGDLNTQGGGFIGRDEIAVG